MLPLAMGIFCLLGMGNNSAFAQARLQVIHNSPSPTVDVYVNGTLLLDDFTYRSATSYIDVPSGVTVNVGVALSTSTSVNDTLVNFPVSFTAGETYVAIANGIVGNVTTPFTLNLTDGHSEIAATAGNVEFRVVHGATDAPTVDVFARTVAKLVDDASYGDVTGYISVAPDQYYLDVTPGSDSTTIVGTFDADLSGLADSTAVVFASGFLAPTAGQPDFGLFAALPGGAVVELTATEVARLQVIHNSADPTVDVYLGTDLLLDDFVYRTATPFIWAPAGEELTIGVALSSSMSVADTITSFKATLDNGGTYVALASGLVGNATTPFTLNINAMAREANSTGADVEFAVVHGATDAPAVDVFARGVAKLVDDAAYGDITNYLSVPADQYYLDVTLANDSTTIAGTFNADLSGLGGGVATVFASGFLAPAAGQPAFGLFAALPDGNVVEFPSSPVARLQVIHNSASPTVDVYLGSTLLLDDFTYRDATPFIFAPANEELTIGIALDNSSSVNDTITSFKVTLDNAGTYVALASGIVGNATTPFTLNINAMARETNAAGSGVEFAVVHGATDAPAVDVFARLVAKLVDDAAYGDITDYISVPADQYYLDVTLANDSTTIAGTFNADLSGLDGGVATVFASGFLAPAAGEPAFGLFAALPDGNVVEFPSSPVARLQVIHNSADPTVDIYLGSDLLLDDFAYRTATEFIWAPADQEITIGVALDNSTSVADTLVGFKVTLDNAGTYVALASGIVGNATTPFTLNLADMVREEGTDPANVDFIVVHGSTDAPTVDVTARTVATLVDDASYGDITDYISVPAAQYYLDVTPGADPATIVGTFDADLTGLGGGSAVVFASGLLTPGMGEPAFGIFAALADGTVVPFPGTEVARLQVIHNSASPTVDIYLDSDLLLDDFVYRTATEYIWAPAGTEFTIGVALDNSTSVADTIVGFPLTLMNGETYIAVASGLVGNATTPFTLLPYAGAREVASDPANIDVLVHHGSTDAPGVDVILENVGPIANDLNYTDFQGYVNPPAQEIRLLIAPEKDSANFVATYKTDLTGLEGSAITVFASGFFDGSMPAFGLWAALADGTTFALDVTTSLEDLELDLSLVSIYPNPASDFVTMDITTDKPGIANVRLFDLQGRELVREEMTVTAGNNVMELGVSQLPTGTYTVLAEVEGAYAVKKLVVTR